MESLPASRMTDRGSVWPGPLLYKSVVYGFPSTSDFLLSEPTNFRKKKRKKINFIFKFLNRVLINDKEKKISVLKIGWNNLGHVEEKMLLWGQNYSSGCKMFLIFFFQLRINIYRGKKIIFIEMENGCAFVCRFEWTSKSKRLEKCIGINWKK